ncbi:phenylalanine--tRNA ligase subunit beta [Jeotgalibacillus proteolyticus]|uniref:Phenylalanine--tRNA ligase beta subunit n=1 Tax=Jeotgalibacillus proteolyticus TaxID=2082395 RepID=A0A2S5GF94_9BACL|nr:phenylalanine--tRNA ligase subunit beta [Jeotgalibacillus proteolyticus]PPA71591.1 phenylalanine--tRNA ligase subunit beta [Jeotgalibacillus proteolyticus]
MFVSYKWLQDYVDLSGITPEDLAEKITRSGIEVEGIEVPAEGVENVVIGHVLSCEKHPEADKLNICLVDVGEEEPVQIICGAANVGAGQKVAVAKVGAVLPGNFKIKKAKLRGEASNGMICSLQEIGIEGKLVPKEFAEGIFNFPQDAPVGEDAIEALMLNDSILELGLTPNRADAMSLIGVAYETGAIIDRPVKLPESDYTSTVEKASDVITVEVEAKQENPIYLAKVIKNIKIGPSPQWMQSRLIAAGIRPHNNVVDITNYVLLEYGQPLHAFDLDRLKTNKILVRLAKPGEKIETLDDTVRELLPHHLVITNGEEPVAIAGVMGGANTEVTGATVNVLLESAYFASSSIRQTSKDHGLRSEASSRYEKGVDPIRVELAAERAAQLLALYADGEVLSGTVAFDEQDKSEKQLTIELEKINRVLGMSLKTEEVLDLFRRLQINAHADGETIYVSAPTRRGDLVIEEDLIEEVARLYGYDHIPMTLPVHETNPGGLSVRQQKRRLIRQVLEGAGLMQAVTYSLTNDSKAGEFALDVREPVKLMMPMSEERSNLRLSIVPQLLESVSYNLARQQDSIAFYETGSVFLKEEGHELPKEDEHVAGAITGLWHFHAWQGEKKQADFYVLKGILDSLFERLGVASCIRYEKGNENDLHPGRTAAIYFNDEKIGYVGQVHPSKEKELDLKETYVFEVKLEAVYAYGQAPLQYTAIPRYPSITRDIALVVDREVQGGELERIIKEAGGSLLKSVKLFDLYEGDKMEEGKKSLAFSLNYMDPSRTLIDEEVVKAHDKVLKAVKEEAGADLRG